MRGIADGSWALYGFNNQIAATEEHQPAPVRMRTVQRHVEPEPRAVKGRGALGIASRDDDVIHRGDRRLRSRGRVRTLRRPFEKEQPDATRDIGRGAGALP